MGSSSIFRQIKYFKGSEYLVKNSDMYTKTFELDLDSLDSNKVIAISTSFEGGANSPIKTYSGLTIDSCTKTAKGYTVVYHNSSSYSSAYFNFDFILVEFY